MVKQLFNISNTGNCEYLESNIDPKLLNKDSFNEDSFHSFLNLCDGNYHIWYYLILVYRSKLLGFEMSLEFLCLLVRDFPKNYQLWNYIDKKCSSEFKTKLICLALEMDSKNYHAWEILCQDSLDYPHSMLLLNEDPNNNSVKNYLTIGVTQ